MSDDFAICPECKAFDCGFTDLNNGNSICDECGVVILTSSIVWKHVEYKNGRVVD